MATFEGTYNSFLRGVSQQIPQEREDGQLGSQTNMLSDLVTGIRRRSGFKYTGALLGASEGDVIKVVDILGTYYIMVINTATGTVRIYNTACTLLKTYVNSYFTTVYGSASIRTVVSRNNCYIVNTEKVPTKTLTGGSAGLNPNHAGYFSVRQGAFTRQYVVKLRWSTFSKEFSWMSDGSTASQVTPTFLTLALMNLMSVDTDVTAAFNLNVDNNVVAITPKGTPTWDSLTVETGDSSLYIMTSGTSRVDQRTSLLGILPSQLDGYVMGVGTLKNSAYYQYSKDTNTWKEVGKWELPYTITNEPMYWTYDSTLPDPIPFKSLGIKMRSAGDDENNPLPEFIGFGITGIGTYQSRLILLAGAYVNLSKTTDFTEFSRTTVTELLDDDAISVSSASLSSAQFEYAIPYNKDLVLISRTRQAVIPSNSTVLTPKTAVIYPSNEVELSLACEPAVVARSLYYTYQRGSDYFQVGEFIPNSYTDAQYLAQGLTDHLPLYATGVCTNMAVSTTNNMVVFTSGSTEVFINQYLWQGDSRIILSFHKWELPFNVLHSTFIQDVLYIFMFDPSTGHVVVGTNNVQYNQLDDKPTPYLDMYRLINIVDGVGTVNFVTEGMKAAVYSVPNMRHHPTMFNVAGGAITCPYDGVISIGYPYTSEFSITPPFIKDNNGKALTGVKSTVNSLRMSFRSTSTFHAKVSDAFGVSYDYTQDTPLTWSETTIGMATINNIGSVTIPCRTQMNSTNCSISTDSTTDMNLISTEYVIRYQGKHRRL